MSFAKVGLHSLGVNKERGEVPVFITKTLQINYASLLSVVSHDKVKVRRSLEPQAIEIDVPDISKILKCDTCSFIFYNVATGTLNQNTNDIMWFYITGFEEITWQHGAGTTVTSNVRLYLEPIPITSYMDGDTVFSILPERLPSATAHIMQNWTDSIMVKTVPNTVFPTLPKTPTAGTAPLKRTLWCEVVFTSTNNLRKFGFFTYAEDISGPPDNTGTRNVFTGKPNGTYSGYQEQYQYPTLAQIIDDPITYLAITGAQVVDINVSEYCPYQTRNVTIGSFEGVALVQADDSVLYASVRYHKGITYGGITFYQGISVYDISSYTSNTTTVGLKENTGTLTYTLSDYEKNNGQIIFKDTLRNAVLAIPRELNETSMSVDYRVFSDDSNIYLSLQYGDMYSVIPGYKIPWTTSSWDEYRAFNLQYDRQALQNNIDFVNREMNTSIINGASNALIGGVIAGAMTGGAAAAGIGAATGGASLLTTVISSNLNREMQIDRLTKDQRLTEQRMKNGPSNLNNPAYGYALIWSILSTGGSEMILELPAGFDKDAWEDQTDIWGYPSNKILQTGLSLSDGYWKGRPMTFSGLINAANAGNQGVFTDRIVTQMENGVHIKMINS